jgi:hypothetical protein
MEDRPVQPRRCRAMTEADRNERTANLLITRLEALARAASRLPTADVERLVESATVATMRAVALDLLEAERAHAIWREAHDRHPHLRALEPSASSDRLAA